MPYKGSHLILSRPPLVLRRESEEQNGNLLRFTQLMGATGVPLPDLAQEALIEKIKFSFPEKGGEERPAWSHSTGGGAHPELLLGQGKKRNIFLPSLIQEMLLPNKQLSVARVSCAPMPGWCAAGAEWSRRQAQAPPLLSPAAGAWRMRGRGSGCRARRKGCRAFSGLQRCGHHVNSDALAALDLPPAPLTTPAPTCGSGPFGPGDTHPATPGPSRE